MLLNSCSSFSCWCRAPILPLRTNISLSKSKTMGQSLKKTVDFFLLHHLYHVPFIFTIIMQCFLSEKHEDEKITVDEKPSIKEAPVVEEGTDYTDDDDGNPISILCHLPKDQEACTYSPAWFYDPAKGDCTRLIYGKCPGDNKNKFNSWGMCRDACGSTPGSHVPKKKGNDYQADHFPRHSYKRVR